MANRIYNVKQAAKILGLSTNTTYKYLNEGRIKAARGHIRGTFIITEKALENFLGTKLPGDDFWETDGTNTFKTSGTSDPEVVIEVAPPTLALKVARVLILVSLVFIIAELLISQNFSPLTQVLRLLVITVMIIVTYQFGGFFKK